MAKTYVGAALDAMGNTSQNPKTDEPRRSVGATRAYEDAQEVIRRLSERAPRPAEHDVVTGQLGSGTHIKQWRCEHAKIATIEGETELQHWSRHFTLIRQIQRDLTQLNADQLKHELEASVTHLKPKGQAS